jgi:hypothetical protein
MRVAGAILSNMYSREEADLTDDGAFEIMGPSRERETGWRCHEV